MEHQSVDFQKPSFWGLWNAVSWNFRYLGVPSDGEKVVRRRLVEFLVFNLLALAWLELARLVLGLLGLVACFALVYLVSLLVLLWFDLLSLL